MSERTQLTFVWFTGSFLKSLFDNMFESVRISEDSVRYVSLIGTNALVMVKLNMYVYNPYFLDSRLHSRQTCGVCARLKKHSGPALGVVCFHQVSSACSSPNL
jgi:hypothetical protein